MSFLKPVSLAHAVPLLRLARVVSGLKFILPVVVLFYQDKGLTIGDFFLLQGVFAFAIFAFEIPSGYVGDILSRKMVLFLSFLALFLGNLVWYLFEGFFFVLVGELLFGVSAALYSGTGEAYVFDVLKKQDKESAFLKEISRLNTWGIGMMAASAWLGGVFYDQAGADGVMLFQVIARAVALVMVLFLPDIPEVRRVVAEGASKWADVLDISKYATRHREIKWLMLFPAVFSAGIRLLIGSFQPLMIHANIPVFMFGVFAGISQFCKVGFSHFSPRLFHKLKTRNFSLLLFGMLCVGTVLIVAMPFLDNRLVFGLFMLPLSLAVGTKGAMDNVASSMINHRIKSDERATVLSVSSMFTRAFAGVVMIVLKFMIDGWTLSTTFAVMGGVVLLLTGYSLVKLLRLRLA